MDYNSCILDINTGIYQKLCTVLDRDSLWKQLVENIPCVAERISVEEISQKYKQKPTWMLLYELGSYGLTLGELVEWLKYLQLEAPLLLLIADEPLEIITQPTPYVEVEEDQNNGLTLVCEARGFPFPQYTWFHDGEELETSKNSVLHIFPVKIEHKGSYFCQVFNYNRQTEGFNKVISTPVEVKVKPKHQSFYFFELPEIIAHPINPSNGKTSQGSSLLLNCTASSKLPVHYQWYRNRAIMSGETRSDLELRNIYPKDGVHKWTYQCQVSNDCGSVLSKEVVVELDSPNDDTPYYAVDKIALLIANANYMDNIWKPVPASIADVREMSDLLTKAGFRIFAFQNLTLDEMKNAVSLFCSQLRKGVYGLFFYVGHGFEHYKQNFLVPVDSSCNMNPSENLCAQFVAECMVEKNTALNVLLLDTCRFQLPNSNPEKIYISEGMRNTIYGFSTGSNHYSCEVRGEKNGKYVKYLKKYLLQKEPIYGILLKVQEDMELDEHVSEMQYPSMVCNLSRRLSLLDPLNRSTSDDQNYKTLLLQWQKLTEPPAPCKFSNKEDGVSLEIWFRKHLDTFCNTMDVIIRLLLEEKSAEKLKDFEIDMILQNSAEVNCDRNRVKIIQTTSYDLETVFTITSLQILQAPLNLQIVLYHRNLKLWEVNMCVQDPLITKAEFWRTS
ncbi:mucosa-associated lymphoid tissue lymphoma translocation protein 1-like [Limulus polyphemus]|uniref:Mucosa-associated lymphoid tissue lymphoma translocation protein 1-like n=1 Tax=Limulus polyphemus TaxID=6850 RepID=A0ABM1BWF8_LIMPO|nr:mucosa-associated lymphoid tissue lymphoma translocation protein 1-like [Limulus polyphemus]XP_022234947.1 mucosa-associated lymphoid tissue lymphoma translocation protein 1-like [Limulus polyphemus]XP_022234949.1 mucosa-associated lymphoid tissue lymphoma translocation protein 1-like [Limulus polyphemus]XP_022234953.1 mucosa-associated lymphoid tissue lymphoma translocation protein 1-like [Limulus polyphemus]